MKRTINTLFILSLSVLILSGCQEGTKVIETDSATSDGKEIDTVKEEVQKYKEGQVVDKGVLAGVPIIAVDNKNNPHVISYTYDSWDIRYAKLENNEWQNETIDSEGNVGDGHDIAVDHQGNPHVIYRDITNGTIKYAKKTDQSWETQTLDTPDENDHIECSSIAIDSNGHPHVVYGTSIAPYFKYAWWDGSSWNIETPGISSYFIWFDLDANNNPHIATLDSVGSDEEYYIKYITKLSDGSWKEEMVDTETPVEYDPRIAVDSNNYPHFGYRGASGIIKYAFWNGTSWDIQIVDDRIAEISAGAQMDFALDKEDNPYFVYALPGEGLILATINKGEWTYEVVGPSHVCAIAVDQLNRAHIVYTDEKDDGENIKYVLID